MCTVRPARPFAALTLSVVAFVAAAAPAKHDDQILIQGLAAGSQAVIIPGTDSLAGYTLLHELELYARAGIPSIVIKGGHIYRPAQIETALGIAPAEPANSTRRPGES
jgi:hypothetical protein